MLLGGESNVRWKLIQANQQSIPCPELGYGLLTEIDQSMLELIDENALEVVRAHKVGQRIAFTKAPDV